MDILETNFRFPSKIFHILLKNGVQFVEVMNSLRNKIAHIFCLLYKKKTVQSVQKGNK